METILSAAGAILYEHVLTPKVLWAIVLVSPKIFSTLAAWAIGLLLDNRIKRVLRSEENCRQRITDLDKFTERVEQYQLYRASFLMILNATGGDDRLKLRLDRIFRLNAQSAIRRVEATVYPIDWKTRIRPFDDIVATDYGVEQISKLQELETGVDLDARSALTNLQGELKKISAQREALEARKERVTFLVNSVGNILTIFAFFASSL
jgi:hypothetical protein